MEQKPDEAWFYSKGGERLGPVSHDELQAKITAGELHPRTDLAWQKGMDNWQALAELKDRFELPQTGAAPAPPATPKPQALPQAGTKPEPKPQAPSPLSPKTLDSPKTLEPVIQRESRKSARDLDWSGLQRRGFIFATLVIPILFSGVLHQSSDQLEQLVGKQQMIWVTWSGVLIPSLIAVIAMLMRLSNLAMNRWWFLASFVPILNLWVNYRCFACPPGYAAHKKMDGIGIALAILYWLALLAIVAALVAGAMYCLKRIAEDPEFKQQMIESIREFRDQLPQR